MRRADPEDSSAVKEFVTVALHDETAATEAFQISDQCVQMTSEDVFAEKDNSTSEKQHLTARSPIVVDGAEKTEVDSVLMLVPTGIAEKRGKFLGPEIKGGGCTFTLRKKEKKFLKALLDPDDGADDEDVLEFLRDFRVAFFFYEKLDQKGKDMLVNCLSTHRKRKLGGELRQKLSACFRGGVI